MEKEPPQNNHSNEEEYHPWDLPGDEWLDKFFELNDPDLPHETRECPNCSEDMDLLIEPAHGGLPEQQYFYCWNCDYVVLPDDEDDFDEEDDGEGEDSPEV